MSSTGRHNGTVIARLHDGLGNQLFIYAAARALATARGATLLVDEHSGFAHDRRYGASCQIRHFAIEAPRAPCRLSYDFPLGRQLRDLETALSLKLPLQHRFMIREADFDAASAGAPLRDVIRAEGYWQSPRYFSQIADDIRREFRVVTELSAQSEAVRRDIRAANAIGLHVRQMHGAHHAFNAPPPKAVPQLPYDYYEEAVTRIAARAENPVFFCFADNFEWIRERWNFPWPIRYVDHNRGSDNAHEDIALMRECRHFIVGNSTFSWWGAWLCDAPDKRVVAPSNTGAVPWGSEKDLFPADWDVLPIRAARG